MPIYKIATVSGRGYPSSSRELVIVYPVLLISITCITTVRIMQIFKNVHSMDLNAISVNELTILISNDMDYFTTITLNDGSGKHLNLVGSEYLQHVNDNKIVGGVNIISKITTTIHNTI